jgi:hypothetical protein
MPPLCVTIAEAASLSQPAELAHSRIFVDGEHLVFSLDGDHQVIKE